MASTDTWDEFLAKLDKSPLGQKHAGMVNLSEQFRKEFQPRPAPTNPATPGFYGSDI